MRRHRLKRRYGRSAGKVTREQIDAAMLKCGILRTKLSACEAKVTKLIAKRDKQAAGLQASIAAQLGVK